MLLNFVHQTPKTWVETGSNCASPKVAPGLSDARLINVPGNVHLKNHHPDFVLRNLTNSRETGI